MRRLLLGSALALGTLSACGAAPPVATAGDAARANIALGDLQQGRTLLIRKCGNCHQPPLPASQPIAQWPAKVDAMAARSKLEAGQRELIEQYLIAMATR